jgi:hypothetical protein
MIATAATLSVSRTGAGAARRCVAAGRGATGGVAPAFLGVAERDGRRRLGRIALTCENPCGRVALEMAPSGRLRRGARVCRPAHGTANLTAWGACVGQGTGDSRAFSAGALRRANRGQRGCSGAL